MSKSSEEVLLIINNVRHKKCDGALYMMGERMAWMPGNKHSFTVSHNYADIKVQKISPDSKEKVQLQVVMHDGGANTFHFSNSLGREVQAKDREGIKDLLQQLLPKFRRKVNSELEEKHRMLQEDPELFQLYKDLVVSGVVTAEEFWATRSDPNPSQPADVGQTIGVSAAFLADVKPQADGCNGLKYNLTSDIIESIFKTYPAVKMKHAECVPDKLSDQEFWTKFFQSHYFHRDRINFGNKDLFAECAKSDDQVIKETISKPTKDLLVDLTSMKDGAIGGGYGLDSDQTPESANPANASLIKRFNQHSTMVLKACDKNTPSTSTEDAKSSQGIKNGSSNLGSDTVESLPIKKAKIREKVKYDDLAAKLDGSSGPSLKLTHTDRFLQGPTPIRDTHYHTSEDILAACQASAQEMMAWKPQFSQVLGSQSAVSVLWELSPGGSLMQGCSQQRINQLVQQETQQEIKQLYNALGELLRHFWSCFPVTSKVLEEKVLRMRANLERFQFQKLRPFKEKISAYHYNIDLTGHLDSMLDAAYTIFNNWQTRRLNKRS